MSNICAALYIAQLITHTVLLVELKKEKKKKKKKSAIQKFCVQQRITLYKEQISI